MTRGRRALTRLGELLREGHVGAALVLATRILPSKLLCVRAVVVTRSERVPTHRWPTSVQLRQLGTGERLSLARCQSLESDDPAALIETFERDLRAGRQGFVAEVDGRMVGYVWAARGSHFIKETRTWLRLRADEACTYRAYVAPKYRATRVYSGLKRFVLTTLRQEGVRYFVGYGDVTNLHSIRTHGRQGYEVTGWSLLVECPVLSLGVRRMLEENGRLRWRLWRPPLLKWIIGGS